MGMLLLTRTKDKSAVIDLRQWGLGLVEITPTGKRNQIAFKGDPRIPIHRREVFEKIEAGANDDTILSDDGGPTL